MSLTWKWHKGIKIMYWKVWLFYLSKEHQKKLRTLKRLSVVFLCLKLAAISTIQLIFHLLPQDRRKILRISLPCICNKMLTNSFCFVANSTYAKRHISSVTVYPSKCVFSDFMAWICSCKPWPLKVPLVSQRHGVCKALFIWCPKQLLTFIKCLICARQGAPCLRTITLCDPHSLPMIMQAVWEYLSCGIYPQMTDEERENQNYECTWGHPASK